MENYVIGITWNIDGVIKQVTVYPDGKRRFIFYEPLETFYNKDITSMNDTLYDELIAEALECNAVLIRVPLTQKASTACTAQYMDN